MEMSIRFNNFVLTDLRIGNMIGYALETDLIYNWVGGTSICAYVDDGISEEVLFDLPMLSIIDFGYC
jgi:hypothetical protein